MSSTPPAITLPTLPTWTDPGAVTSYLLSLAAFVVAVVAMFHPGFQLPQVVQALAVPLGLVVAGAVQAVHVATHRSAHSKALAAAYQAPLAPGPAQSVRDTVVAAAVSGTKPSTAVAQA